MSARPRVIGLWAAPRSVSTAFERIMRERGDLECFHEPFLGFYYYGEERSHERFAAEQAPDDAHRAEAIRDSLLATAERKPVFFKDLAFYLSRRRMDPGLVSGFENTFLIRHPSLALASLYRLQPDTTWEENGFERLLELMRVVREASGEPLVVVDAERLKADPESVYRDYCDRVGLPYVAAALEWKSGSPTEQWQPWERWHREAMSSTEIEPPTEEQRVALDSGEPQPPENVPADVYARCLEIFSEISELAGEGGATAR